MSAKLWVGQVNGRSLVYDPDIQLPECEHVFLWDPETREMRTYVTELARNHIKAHDNVQVAALLTLSTISMDVCFINIINNWHGCCYINFINNWHGCCFID